MIRASGQRVVGVRPDVPVGARVVLARARLLEPRVVGRRVVHDEVGDDAHAALVRLLDERLEVVDVPVVGVDAEEVGDVVAAVAERRLVHRQEPDAVDAEPLQVVELLDQPAEVAGAVVVAVVEAADVDLVEHRRLEPERVALEPVARFRHGSPGRRFVDALAHPRARRRHRTCPVGSARRPLWTNCHVPFTVAATSDARSDMRLELEDVRLARVEADVVAADRPPVALAAEEVAGEERRR